MHADQKSALTWPETTVVRPALRGVSMSQYQQEFAPSIRCQAVARADDLARSLAADVSEKSSVRRRLQALYAKGAAAALLGSHQQLSSYEYQLNYLVTHLGAHARWARMGRYIALGMMVVGLVMSIVFVSTDILRDDAQKLLVLIFAIIWMFSWMVLMVFALMREDDMGDFVKDIQKLRKKPGEFEQYNKVYGEIETVTLLELMRLLEVPKEERLECSEDSFILAASDILVPLAERVLLAERPDLRCREYEEASTAKDLRQNFAIAFSQCLDAGLVEGADWTPFFDEAERHLIEAKTK